MKVVIAFPWNVDDELLAPLREQFPDLEIAAQPYYGAFAHHVPGASEELTDDERAVWADADAALALDLPKEIGEIAPGLRWVQAIGAGVEHLDAVGLPDDCIVTNAAGVAAASIAEFVIGRLLQVWKRFDEIDQHQRAHEWKPKYGLLVEGLTVGIIGLGAIGTEVAVRARAFGMTTIGTRRSYRPGHTHDAVDELRGSDDLHDVLPRCDAVVVERAGDARDREPVRRRRLRGDEAGCPVLQRRARFTRRRARADRRAGVGASGRCHPRRHP